MRALGAILAVLLATPAFAQSGQELVGTWKREDGKLFRFDWDEKAGEITGVMLDPPANSVTRVKYDVTLRLRREGDKVTGKATWTDHKTKSKGVWTADAFWELAIVEPGKLKGRSESFSFGWGAVTDRRWDDHELVRLPLVTLGAAGSKAPEKVEAGEKIDEAALAGTWKSSGGAYFSFKKDGAGFVLESVGSEAGSAKLVSEAGVLRGLAILDGGEAKVELRLAAAGRLEGRTESLEGGKENPTRAWVALALEKLPRYGEATEGPEPPPLPDATGELTLTDWKRDDGLFLQIDPADPRMEVPEWKGRLVSRKGEVLADLVLRRAKAGTYAGDAYQGDYPAKWTLSVQADGTLEGRCSWVDIDPATKTPVRSGSVKHTFKPLKKIG